MCKLLGYTISNLSQKELVNSILQKKGKTNIISGNPQVLYNGMKEEKLFRSFNKENSLIIPDGVGIVMPLKLSREKIEKVAGIDLFKDLIKELSDKNETIYFLGSTDEVLIKMINILKKENANIKIVGYHNGFIDIKNCHDLINEIKEKKPKALFVAMGSPKQEVFIDKYMDELPCDIFMGVGGSFDVISSTKKRAPSYIINMNLEWLYRIAKEPYRIKEFSKNIVFLGLAFVDLTKKYKEDNKEKITC